MTASVAPKDLWDGYYVSGDNLVFPLASLGLSEEGAADWRGVLYAFSDTFRQYETSLSSADRPKGLASQEPSTITERSSELKGSILITFLLTFYIDYTIDQVAGEPDLVSIIPGYLDENGDPYPFPE